MNFFCVYAIKSSKDGRIYVGLTSDLARRVREHNQGQTKSTKPWRPWQIIYKKEFLTRGDARCEEKRLKSGYKKEFLKSL